MSPSLHITRAALAQKRFGVWAGRERRVEDGVSSFIPYELRQGVTSKAVVPACAGAQELGEYSIENLAKHFAALPIGAILETTRFTRLSVKKGPWMDITINARFADIHGESEIIAIKSTGVMAPRFPSHIPANISPICQAHSSSGATVSATFENASETHSGLRVFVSYSRKDHEFVSRLVGSLSEVDGFTVDYDRSEFDPAGRGTGIDYEGPFWSSLQRMIAQSDAIILVVSPDSASSSIVDDEIVYARSLSKRLIAISCREVDFRSAPPNLSALQVNHWFLTQSHSNALTKLTKALQQDSDWLRQSRALTVGALEWEKGGRRTDKLLHGDEIGEAEQWSARRPHSEPPVSETVLSYIRESRRNQLRRQRIARTAVGFAAIVVAALGVFVIVGQREVGRQTSALFAASSRAAADGQQFDRALRLGVLAARSGVLRPQSVDAEPVMVGAAHASPLLIELRDGDGAISSAALSPDGLLAVTGSADGEVVVWDLDAQRLEQKLSPDGGDSPAHEDLVADADIHPDGQRAATVSHDGVIRVWDLQTGMLDYAMDVEATLYRAEFSPDGRVLMTCGERGSARLWDVEYGTPIGELPHTKGVLACTFSPDGTMIATGSGEQFFLWDRDSRARIADPIAVDGNVTALAFRPDQSGELVVGTANRRVFVFASGAWDSWIRSTYAHGDTVSEIFFDSDGAWAITTSHDGEAHVWNADNWEREFSFLGHRGGLLRAGSASVQKHFITAAADGARVWRIPARSLDAISERLLPGHLAGVYAADIRADDALWITGDQAGVARIWNAGDDSASPLEIALGGGVRATRFSPDGARAVVAGHAPSAKIVDVTTGAVTLELPHERYVEDAAYSPNGALVATASLDGKVRVWNAADGTMTQSFDHPQGGEFRAVAFLGTSERLVAAGSHGVVRTWNVETGEMMIDVNHLPALINTIALHPDGRTIAAGGTDNFVRIFTLGSERAPGPSRTYKLSGQVFALSFMPDGSRLVTSSLDGGVQIWDLASGREVASYPSPDAGVLSLAISSDGSQMLIGSDRANANVLPVDQRVREAGSASSAAADICASSLVLVSDPETVDSPQPTTQAFGIRRVTLEDAAAAPVAADWVGQSVCD